MEAEKTADSPTVFTRWHHAAEALIVAGYGRTEYEYAVLCSYRDKEGANPIRDDEWTIKDKAEETLIAFTTGEGGDFYRDRFIFTLVKRRKAGEIEDA
jgi:hypothetical protein